MLEFITKDLTTVDCGIIGHGVNCQGRMGAGVAKALSSKFPSIVIPYTQLCHQLNCSTELLGTVQMLHITDELAVANAFTQHRYGRNNIKYADISAVDECIQKLFYAASAHEMPLFIPQIGCGLGGLSWNDEVLPLVESQSEIYPHVSCFVCGVK